MALLVLLAFAPPLLWAADAAVRRDARTLPPDHARTHGFAFVVEGDDTLDNYSYSEPPTFYIFPHADGGYAVGFQWSLHGPVEQMKYPVMYISVPEHVTNVSLIEFTMDFAQGNQRIESATNNELPPEARPAVQRVGGRSIIPIEVLASTTIRDEKGDNVQEPDIGDLYISMAFTVPDARVQTTGVGRNVIRVDYAPVFAANAELSLGGADYHPIDPVTGIESEKPQGGPPVVDIAVCTDCEGDVQVSPVDEVQTAARVALREEQGFTFASREINQPLTLELEVADKRWDWLRGASAFVLLVVGAVIGALVGVVYRPTELPTTSRPAATPVTSRRI